MAEREWMALEEELRTLGRAFAFPPTPDVRDAVRARLARSSRARRRFGSRRLVAALAVLLAVAVALATPPGQAAARAVLRFAGIEFHSGPGPISHVLRDVAMLPGERLVTLETARQVAPFPIVVPASLGRPDRVTVSDGGRVVSLLYGQGVGRPAANASGVAVRLDEFDGTLEPVFEKFLSGQDVEQVTVNGRRGAWVAGPHTVLYLDRAGEYHEQAARLSANTLIWQLGDTALRLEGAYTRDQALTVAASAIT